MYPHSIRLHGPWDYSVLNVDATASPGKDVASTGRIKLPCDWQASLGPQFRGRVRYRRTFHCPSSLEPHERVWLVCEGVDASGSVTLNGHPLGVIPGYALPGRFPITELLAPQNELVLDVELLPASFRPGRENLPGGPIGDVRLEIRSQQFLEDWCVWFEGTTGQWQLHIQGRIADEPPNAPLELVLDGPEGELLYLPEPSETISGTAEAVGIPFWSAEQPRLAEIRARLLSGGTRVWEGRLKSAITLPSDLSGRQLVPLDDPRRLPELIVQLSRQAVADRPLLLSESILPPAAYAALDAAGIEMIQHMPALWADQVGPRLAHHPSIVAWTAHGSLPSTWLGRPLLPLSLLRGEQGFADR